MSNSAYVNYVDRSAGRYALRSDGSLIQKITIHSAGAFGDCYDLSEYVNGASGSSYHYGISTDATVCLFVDEEFRSYSTGNLANDDVAVNIICMSTEEGVASGAMNPKAWEALLNLVEDICRRNYILELTYTGNPETSNLTMHRWFGGANCPGPYIANRYPEIVMNINARLTGALKATSATGELKTQSTIAVGMINPYLVTVEPGAVGIDYQILKDNGVIGAMFWAGAYYNSNHTLRDRYINSSLKQQVAEVNKIELPYALYASVRARSVEEAKVECYWLYFVVSKFPPKLGIWLNLELAGSPDGRVKIIDKYYENLYEWGFKDKCGFYATKDQLSGVRYKEYLDRFSVWLISPIGTVQGLNTLLTPSLFKF